MHSKTLKKAGSALIAAAMLANASAVSTAVIADAADSAATKYEFEDAVITGTGSVKTDDTSASGGAYYFLEGNSDTATLTVNVETAGMYEITICYAAAYGEKIQNLYVNGVDQGQISFTSKTWTEMSCGSVKLNAGDNEIMIKGSWGWTNFDYLTVAPATLPDITVTQPYTCDVDATAETQSLMAYLASVYGEHIISGQQEIYKYGPHDFEYEFDYLKDLTGHYPAIRGFDYGNFTCPAFGSDDGSTDRIIDWVKNKNGIATASWHLNVPNDMDSYTVGASVEWAQTSYNEKDNNFKPSNAYTEGTKEYEYYLMALKTLAAEFNKLEAQGIPVIWRPLHEAEGSGGETGSWFWWGKEGSEVYKKLWVYTYKALTEDLNCHNLIWEWNSYNYETSANWYPGDEYVDIIGYDKYNCTVYLEEDNWAGRLVHNDSAISSTFYGIMQKYNSAKMVSMAENDCFSTVDNLISEKAGWLYFCTWYDGGSDNINFLTNPIFNTEADTIAMYQSDYCITLDELPDDLYGQSITDRTTVSTTTTTTTTQDPNATTTTTAYTFETKSYKIDLPEADERGTVTLEIEGAATASIGGGIGYGTNAEDWVNLEWKGNADSDGKLSVKVDISEIPASFTSADVQIWWSNVWDNATKTSTDADCELVDYSFSKGGTDVDVTLCGDANCDEKVNAADAVLILQSIANPDKYGVGGTDDNCLTEQGAANADCNASRDGVTSMDALYIQQYILKLTDLPYNDLDA